MCQFIQCIMHTSKISNIWNIEYFHVLNSTSAYSWNLLLLMNRTVGNQCLHEKRPEHHCSSRCSCCRTLTERNLLMTQNNILFITHGCHPCHDILALKRCSKMDGDGCGMQCIGRRTCNNKPPKTHISWKTEKLHAENKQQRPTNIQPRSIMSVFVKIIRGLSINSWLKTHGFSHGFSPKVDPSIHGAHPATHLRCHQTWQPEIHYFHGFFHGKSHGFPVGFPMVFPPWVRDIRVVRLNGHRSVIGHFRVQGLVGSQAWLMSVWVYAGWRIQG